MKKEGLSISETYKKYFNQIYTTTNAQSSIRQRVWDAVGDENNYYSIEYIPKSGRDKGKLTKQYYTGNKKVLFVWFNNSATINIEGKVIKKEKYGTFWDRIDYNNLNKEGSIEFSSGKKPEQLLQRVIELCTGNNDLVLDFHLGSGTTCAVAHKMGRRYIGIEQMDYNDDDFIIRMKNVINNDNSGISKLINWHGGGSFVYCELMEWNESYITRIKKAKNIKEFIAIWEDMQKKASISYRIDPKTINSNISDFKDLSFEDQKRLLIATLDKNQLYVNYSEIDDKDYQVSETDKKINRIFYGEV